MRARSPITGARSGTAAVRKTHVTLNRPSPCPGPPRACPPLRRGQCVAPSPGGSKPQQPFARDSIRQDRLDRILEPWRPGRVSAGPPPSILVRRSRVRRVPKTWRRITNSGLDAGKCPPVSPELPLPWRMARAGPIRPDSLPKQGLPASTARSPQVAPGHHRYWKRNSADVSLRFAPSSELKPAEAEKFPSPA